MPNPLRAISSFFKRDWARGRKRENRRWDDRRHRCTRCWYDMAGTSIDVCPECGTPKSRGGSIWTDGRWHWRVGWLVLSGAVAILFVILAITDVLMANADTPNERFNARLVSNFAYLGFILCILLLLFFATYRSTREQHQLVRFLVPLGIGVVAAWLGQVLIVNFE